MEAELWRGISDIRAWERNVKKKKKKILGHPEENHVKSHRSQLMGLPLTKDRNTWESKCNHCNWLKYTECIRMSKFIMIKVQGWRRERSEIEKRKGKRKRGQGSRRRRAREQALDDTGENWSTTHSANWQLGGRGGAGEISHLSFISCTVTFPGNQIALIDEGK